MRRVVIILALLLASSPAAAQTYVSASLVGDITRFSHVDVAGADGGGEAIGFGLRLGTSITEVFGVELEFVRPSEIRSSIGAEILPAIGTPVFTPIGTPLFPDLIFPPISYELRTRTRNTTVAASVSAKQVLTARFALVYSGGVAMLRARRDSWFDVTYCDCPIGARPLPRSTVVPAEESVSYSMQPQVGVEARIGMGAHVQLMPALRMNGLEGGWSLRPSVGLGWTF